MASFTPLDDPEIQALIGGVPAPSSDLISEKELADLLGCTSKLVRDLAKQGILERSGPALYERRRSVRAYCARLQQLAAKRGTSDPEYRAEQIRLKREQADALAAKNAAARRELIPAGEVEAAWSAVLREIRAAMLAIPARVQQQLGLSSADVAAIDAEVRSALAEAANDG